MWIILILLTSTFSGHLQGIWSEANVFQSSDNDHTITNSNYRLSNDRPPLIVPDLESKFYFFDSSGASLTCRVDSKPESTVNWISIDLNDHNMRSNQLNYTNVSDTLTFGISHTSMSTSIFYCQATNIYGTARSRKMTVYKVPKLEDPRIRYENPDINVGFKAVISCQPHTAILGSFYKLKYWEIYLDRQPIEKVSKTGGRYSVITAFSDQIQLHINQVTQHELENRLSAACILESIFDPNETLIDIKSRAIIKENTIEGIDARIITMDKRVEVQHGKTLELPCPIIGASTDDVLWRFNDIPIEIKGDVSLHNGNLIIRDIQQIHSGKYKCTHPMDSNSANFLVSVIVPLSVEINEGVSSVAYGQDIELTCRIIGNRISTHYWLFNGKRITEINGIEINDNLIKSDTAIVETLTIRQFSLEHVGVYQCFAETFDDKLAGDGLSNQLIDNAIATRHLMLKSMKPQLISQKPELEDNKKVPNFFLNSLEPFTLNCIFAAHPMGNITWYLDDVPLPDKIKSEYSIQINKNLEKISTSPYLYNASLEMTIDMYYDERELWRFGGEYRATITNDFGNTTCRMFTLVNADLRIRNAPSDVSLNQIGYNTQSEKVKESDEIAILDRQFKMKCYAIGTKMPTLKWRRNYDNEPSKYIPMDHRHELLENGRIFIINSVQMNDEGKYECIASHGSNKASIIKNLKVMRAPVIQTLPKSLNVSFRNELSLYYGCNAMSADKPWYAWWEFQKYHTKGVLIISPDSDRNFLDLKIEYADTSSDNNYVLPSSLSSVVPDFVKMRPNEVANIRNLGPLIKAKHHGNLTCVVRNSVGQARSPIAINFMPEIEFATRPPNSIDVILGQSIFIDCSPKKSEVNVIVEWKFSNQKFPLDKLPHDQKKRIKQHQNGTLSIIEVEEFDPKKFYCFLKHPFESAIQNSSALNLEIHVPARITNMLEEDKRVRGSKFNLTCSVHGDERNRKIDWYFRPKNKTVWKHLRPPTCVLSNDFNSECRTYRSDSEDEIQFIFYTETFDDKLRVDRLLEFTNVNVDYMGEFKCVAVNEYNSIMNNKEKQIIQTDMIGVGIDPRSVESTMKLTIINIPGRASFINDQLSTTSSSLTLKWSEPKDSGNLPLHFYRLHIHSNPPTDIPMISVPANESSWTIDNLKPFTSYTARIEAVNSVGVGPSDSITLVTQESKPTASVRNLNCSALTSDQINVEWDDPEVGHQNGNIDRYWLCRILLREEDNVDGITDLKRINWPQDNSGEIPSQFTCETVHIVRRIELVNLIKFSPYGIRIVAMNNKGSSPPDFCYARTLEDLPQEAPLNVRCTGLQHSLNIAWTSPAFKSINGILSGYKIHYFKTNRLLDEQSLMETKLDPRTSQTIKGLTPHTNYTIRVYAVNKKGKGPPSADHFCLTSEAPPDAPEKIKVVLNNETCATAIWTHPKSQNGIIKNYCLSQQEVSDVYPNRPITSLQYATCFSPDFSLNYQSKQLCNFQMGKYYRLSIRGKHSFEGKSAFSDTFTPRLNTNVSILSIGEEVTVLPGSIVLFNCEMSEAVLPKWTHKNPFTEKISSYENGSISISNVQREDAGTYNCSFSYEEMITYTLKIIELDESFPNPPVWRSSVSSPKSIQIEWNAPAQWPTAPITSYRINWTNHYTGEMDNSYLEANQRIFFLSNLTCATKVSFDIVAENKYGPGIRSKNFEVSTAGEGPKIKQDAQIIVIPVNSTDHIILNMSAFIVGNQCPPYFYDVIIKTTSGYVNSQQRHRRKVDSESLPPLKQNDVVFERRIHKDDLIFIDPNKYKEKWYINIPNLHAASNYMYSIRAENPAGSHIINGNFQSGLPNNNNFNSSFRTLENAQKSLFSRPTILIPLSIFFILLIVLTLSTLFYYRHKKFAHHLFNGNQVNVSNYNGKVVMAIDPMTGLPISNTVTTIGCRNKSLVSQRYNEQKSNQHDPMLAKKKLNQQNNWFENIFGGIKNRKSNKSMDNISVNSIDSQGKINPYATYEATGPMLTSTSQLNTAQTLSAGLKSSSGATALKMTPDEAFKNMLASHNRQVSTPGTSYLHNGIMNKSSWLDPVPTSSLSRRRQIANLKEPQARTYAEHIEYQRNLMMLASSTAKAIIDPINAPYDVGGEGLVSNASIYSGNRSNSGRRFNSMESLNRLGQTYHRGFPGYLNDYSQRLTDNQAGFLYDSNQSVMKSMRQSGINNNTSISSNNEELLQAYEFGRHVSNNEKLILMKQLMSQARHGNNHLINSNESYQGYNHMPMMMKQNVRLVQPIQKTPANVVLLKQTSQPSYHRFYHPGNTNKISNSNWADQDRTYASIDYRHQAGNVQPPPNPMPPQRNVPKRPLPELPAYNNANDFQQRSNEEIDEAPDESIDDEDVYTKEFVVV